MKALVVVADPELREEIADFFARRNHPIISCGTSLEAREHLEQHPFQFVIVDQGADDRILDLCRAVRAQPMTANSYVLVALTEESPAALRDAMLAEVDDYLASPIRLGSLQLRLAIGERDLARRVKQQDFEQRLELAERRYRTLVQTMNEGMIQVDPDGRIEFANARMSTFTGYTVDELTGQPADELLVEEEFRAKLPGQTLLGSGIGSEEYTLPLQTKEGGRTWVKLVGAPIPSGDGRLGSVGLVQDLTEQRAAEEGLKHREEYFRALLESSSDLISILGDDGRVKYQSPSSQRLLDRLPESLIGDDFVSLIHGDDLGDFERALAECRATPAKQATAQIRLRHRGGEWLYFEALLRSLLDDPLLEGVVITSRDVRERRKVEAALKRERAFFQQLFRNSPAGIVILDNKDRVVDANRSFVDLFQFEVDDIAGHPLSDFVVPDELRSEARELSQSVFQNQAVERETVRARKDGSSVDVAILGYPIELADRKIGAYGIYSDISERKAAERKLFHEAFHDTLTGLPNRALLAERLERDLRRAKRKEDYQFALLFIDLDRFKVINDSLGHAAGDELLVEMARRLEQCLRPGDTVARLGGDEFNIILEDIQEAADATRVAERILDSLSQPFEIADQEVVSSGSIGIAFSSTGYASSDD
ncbi:MAG: PAS domain S-box protein, partial [Holophagales bacterium]|nr:PAS domain S-box protein [Holophagales bacterium]